MPAPLLYLNCTNFCIDAENDAIWYKIASYLRCKVSNKNLKIGVRTVTSNGAIWDEFSEHHQHHSPKKALPVTMPALHLFSADKVQIKLTLCLGHLLFLRFYTRREETVDLQGDHATIEKVWIYLFPR